MKDSSDDHCHLYRSHKSLLIQFMDVSKTFILRAKQRTIWCIFNNSFSIQKTTGYNCKHGFTTLHKHNRIADVKLVFLNRESNSTILIEFD